MLEVVDGIVISPVTMTVTVHTPDGKQYGNPRTFEVTEEAAARQWAAGVRSSVLMSLGPEAKRLGFDKPWEMRIHG